MHVTERQVGDVTIVDVSGKVTLGDGGDVVLKDKMSSLVQQGHKKVVLNLATSPMWIVPGWARSCSLTRR